MFEVQRAMEAARDEADEYRERVEAAETEAERARQAKAATELAAAEAFAQEGTTPRRQRSPQSFRSPQQQKDVRPLLAFNTHLARSGVTAHHEASAGADVLVCSCVKLPAPDRDPQTGMDSKLGTSTIAANGNNNSTNSAICPRVAVSIPLLACRGCMSVRPAACTSLPADLSDRRWRCAKLTWLCWHNAGHGGAVRAADDRDQGLQAAGQFASALRVPG